MSKRSLSTIVGIGLVVAFCAWSMTSRDASAQDMHQHSAQAGHNHDHASATRAGGAPMVHRTARGGQMTMIGSYGIEVVYRPKETRVYIYDMNHRPLSARGVQGQMAMTVRGNDKVYRYPLRYVGPQAGAQSADYLALAINVSRIKDGDMSVKVELENLPNRQQPQATFTQTFALSRLSVAVELLDESDSPRIDRQEVCAVSGGKLGSMGTPIKMTAGGQSLFLCCKGCIGKVKKDPDHYLARAAQLRAGR